MNSDVFVYVNLKFHSIIYNINYQFVLGPNREVDCKSRIIPKRLFVVNSQYMFLMFPHRCYYLRSSQVESIPSSHKYPGKDT